MLSQKLATGQTTYESASNNLRHHNLSLKMTVDSSFLEITDSVLGRDILVFSRIVESSESFPRIPLRLSGHTAATTTESVIRFRRNGDDTIVLEVINYPKSIISHPGDRNSAFVANRYTYRIRKRNLSSYVINVSDLFNEDNDLIFLNGITRERLELRNQKAGVTKITSLHNSLSAIELRSTLFFTQNRQISLSTALQVLSRIPMQSRFADLRLNYFTQDITENSNLQSQSIRKSVIRWRLAPRHNEYSLYKKGVLVEPEKPIVFYISPSVPTKWVPFFKQGVEDWRRAFEEAGFKNAIIAKDFPALESDSEFSMFAASNSVIHYLTSDFQDCTYSVIVDPRSGEILQSHVLMSSGILEKLHDDYFIQASPSDAQARKVDFSDELMGKLLRVVVAHEVGHCLGLNHNMIASDAISIRKLRSREWTEKNGITYSIMDYARCNYVAQPGDNIAEQGLIPKIGDYDLWAIQWGYSILEPELENQELNKWATQKNKIQKYRFSNSDIDPRANIEALSNDNIRASALGVKNLKYVLDHLSEWSAGKIDFEKRIYYKIMGQFGLYLDHVAKHIGGMLEIADVRGSVKIEQVDHKTQRRAFKFILDNFISTPQWLSKCKVVSDSSIDMGHLDILQQLLLERLITPVKMNNFKFKKFDSAKDQIVWFLTSITDRLFDDLASAKEIDLYRSRLQYNYLQNLTYVSKIKANKSQGNTEVLIPQIVDAHLSTIKSKIEKAIAMADTNCYSKHLENLEDIISQHQSGK